MGKRVVDATEAATAFVSIAPLFDRKKGAFPDEAAARIIMCDLVGSAGFEPTSVVPGQLRGNYLEQDGCRTGETYAINSFPYKVVTDEGDDYRATGWLDNQYRRVRDDFLERDSVQKVRRLAEAIVESRPLLPIMLTDIGDALTEYPPENVTDKHSRDNDRLDDCVGVHAVCHGWMDRAAASKTHDVILCRSCGLRIGFPKGLETYGDLRRHFAKFNK